MSQSESESDMVETYVASRHGHKWSIPEELQLQREYELLGLPMDYIAYLHRRTYEGIVAKVEKEDFDRPIYSDMNKDMNIEGELYDSFPILTAVNIMVVVAVTLFLCFIKP